MIDSLLYLSHKNHCQEILSGDLAMHRLILRWQALRLGANNSNLKLSRASSASTPSVQLWAERAHQHAISLNPKHKLLQCSISHTAKNGRTHLPNH